MLYFPCIAVIIQVRRFLLSSENKRLDEIGKNCQQAVNFILVVAGLRLPSIPYRFCGIRLHYTISVAIGAGALVIGFYDIDNYLPRLIVLAIDLMIALFSLLYLALAWANYEDSKTKQE